MADPTPEEERDWVDQKLDDPEFRRAFLAELREQHQEDIRAAVAAETERRPTEWAYEQVCKANEAKRVEIKRLREVLEKLARLGNEPEYGNSIGNEIARAALEVSDAEA